MQIPIPRGAGLQFVAPAERSRREEAETAVDLPVVAGPLVRDLVAARAETGGAIEQARKVRPPVLRCPHRIVVREVAAVAADDVQKHAVAYRALQFDLLQLGRIFIVTRGRERPEAAAVALRLRLIPVLPDADQPVVFRNLPRQLPVVLGQQRVVVVRDRLITREIDPVGTRPGYQAQYAAVAMLVAVSAVKPQFVADDAAAQIGGDEVVIVQILRVTDTLGDQRRRQVVALRLLALIRTLILSVELVATGLEDGDHLQPRRAHFGAGARGHRPDLFHAGVVEVHRRVGIRPGRDVDPLDLNLRRGFEAVRRHRGTLGHLAAADIGRPCARDSGRHLDDRLEVATARHLFKHLAGERRARARGR